MNATPTDLSSAANALRSYLTLGVIMSDQAAFMQRTLNLKRVILKQPIGMLPIGDCREHTELRARPEGFSIFRGTGRDRRSLLSATVSDDSFDIVGGELMEYLVSERDPEQNVEVCDRE